MRLVKCLLPLALVSLVPLAACGGGDESGPSCAEELASAETTTKNQYVISEVKVPKNPNEALQLALNVDGDDKDRKENRVGTILGTLAAEANFDVQAAVDEAVQAGDVVLLAELESTDLTKGCGQVSVHLGKTPANPPACIDPQDSTTCGKHLDGNGTFEIDTESSPANTSVAGTIAGGRFLLSKNDDPGSFTVELNLIEGQEPITLKLIGARIEIAQISPDGLMEGLIAGAIEQDLLDTAILPTVHNLVVDAFEGDCALVDSVCTCTKDSPGEIIKNIFDDDQSCDITLNEIKEDVLIASLLTADVDLLNGTDFDPNQDGTKESLSIGLGFTAVKGQF